MGWMILHTKSWRYAPPVAGCVWWKHLNAMDVASILRANMLPRYPVNGFAMPAAHTKTCLIKKEKS